MKPLRQTPSFGGLKPASEQASAAARGASSKRDTKPELLLRRALWAQGLRYRVDVSDLPGRPDVVFSGPRVAVFCDGDFWHGRGLAQRLARLKDGHNGSYWVAKIAANVERDVRHRASLEQAGWLVMRFWETDIRVCPEAAAAAVLRAVRKRTGIHEVRT
jgi:DNA mismatch endonuclease (patch repair protein)